MAGLRAHLGDRAQSGIGGVWLLFGERNAALRRTVGDEGLEVLAEAGRYRRDF